MSAEPTGVVLQGTGGIWRVRLPDGAVVPATLRGRIKMTQVGGTPGAPPPKLAVGDEVRLEAHDDGWAIAGILPRRSRLARRAPGGGPGERVLCANVDRVVIVFAAARPEPHLRMLDRFLVIAEANALEALVVINKVELIAATEVRERFADYERAGYCLVLTSVKRGDGLDELRESLRGKVSVLTGPSGVGKSSIINALFPGVALPVGEISASVNKGRHTTVGGTMVPLPGDDAGYVVDTPGLREVGLLELPADRLDLCFPELRARREACRFADCQHVSEPQCAVLEAVESGEVSGARYGSYVSLLAEREAELKRY